MLVDLDDYSMQITVFFFISTLITLLLSSTICHCCYMLIKAMPGFNLLKLWFIGVILALNSLTEAAVHMGTAFQWIFVPIEAGINIAPVYPKLYLYIPVMNTLSMILIHAVYAHRFGGRSLGMRTFFYLFFIVGAIAQMFSASLTVIHIFSQDYSLIDGSRVKVHIFMLGTTLWFDLLVVVGWTIRGLSGDDHREPIQKDNFPRWAGFYSLLSSCITLVDIVLLMLYWKGVWFIVFHGFGCLVRVMVFMTIIRSEVDAQDTESECSGTTHRVQTGGISGPYMKPTVWLPPAHQLRFQQGAVREPQRSLRLDVILPNDSHSTLPPFSTSMFGAFGESPSNPSLRSGRLSSGNGLHPNTLSLNPRLINSSSEVQRAETQYPADLQMSISSRETDWVRSAMNAYPESQNSQTQDDNPIF